jgi:pyruvate dehydrogenase E2 component (dihydrolipoyllysine-residue acetyltransferase)
LTFDHRIVDGGPAARFLQTLAQLIENPERSEGFEVLR